MDVVSPLSASRLRILPRGSLVSKSVIRDRRRMRSRYKSVRVGWNCALALYYSTHSTVISPRAFPHIYAGTTKTRGCTLICPHPCLPILPSCLHRQLSCSHSSTRPWCLGFWLDVPFYSLYVIYRAHGGSCHRGQGVSLSWAMSSRCVASNGSIS